MNPSSYTVMCSRDRYLLMAWTVHKLADVLTVPGNACRAAIQKLKEDNAKLKEELLLENKFSVTPTTANAAALISNLQEQSDVYTRKVIAAAAAKPL